MDAKKIIVLGIFGVLVLVVLMIFVPYPAVYNKVKYLNEDVIEAGGNVDSALQRRYDLLPNLAAIYKKQIGHEDEIYKSITDARAKIGQLNVNLASNADPETIKQYMAMQNQIGGNVSRIVAILESNPEIKSNEQAIQLMDQIEGTENRINVARVRYNERVKLLNQQLERFIIGPMISKSAGVKRRSPFEASVAARTAPDLGKALEK